MTMPRIYAFDMTRTVNDVRRILAKIFDNLPSSSMNSPIPSASELNSNMIEQTLAGLQPFSFTPASSITVAEANQELRALSLAQAFMLEIRTIPLLSTVVHAMAEDLRGEWDVARKKRMVAEWQRWIGRLEQQSMYGEALRSQQTLIIRYVQLISTLMDIQTRINSERPLQ